LQLRIGHHLYQGLPQLALMVVERTVLVVNKNWNTNVAG